jgi:phosphosulfolactate phosphohydrolase-like enzyme
MEAVKKAEQTYAAAQQKIKDTRQKNKAALEYRASIEKKFKELGRQKRSIFCRKEKLLKNLNFILLDY